MNDLPPLDPLDDLASAALDDGLDGRDLDAAVAARVAAFAEVRRALRAGIPPPSESARESAIAAALAVAGTQDRDLEAGEAGTRAPVVPIAVAGRRRANRLRAAAAAVAVAAGAGAVALAVGGGGTVLPAAVSAPGTEATPATAATEGARTFEQATAEGTGDATLAAPAAGGAADADAGAGAARGTEPAAAGTSTAAVAATSAATSPVYSLGDVADLTALLAAVRERLAAPGDRSASALDTSPPACPVDAGGETVLLASARLGGEPVLVAARRTDTGVVVEVFGDDCRLRSTTPLG